MEAVRFNDFVPSHAKQENKSPVQINFEEKLRLHLLPMDLNYEQREKLKSAFKLALATSADSYFYSDPNNSSWIGYNNEPVLPTNEDIKPFFDNAIDQFEIYIAENWKRLIEERTSALLVKAKNALFAAYKFNFSTGTASPKVICFGDQVRPTNPAGVNINRLTEKAVEIFGGLLLTGIEKNNYVL